MKRCLTLLLALVLALSLAACGAKSAGPDTMTGDYNGYESAKEDYDFSATDDEPEGAGAWNGDGQVGSGIDKSLSERGVKMIYSAHIEMQTLSYEQAVEDIAALVERSGAYFEQKNFSNYSSGYRHASYTVRVPAEQFADFCAQVGTLCHVTWQDDSAENISERYYDTQSRLETAQIKLARLQELLKKAENMEDIITIESAISETEYEIERLSGTMRHYDALVDYATVTLELNEVYRLSGTEDARPCRRCRGAGEFCNLACLQLARDPDFRGGRVCGREAHHPPAPGKEAAEARQEKEKRGRFRR